MPIHTGTYETLPSPSYTTEGKRSELSDIIVCDVIFWRIKDVSSNNVFSPCIERRVNFSYTWHSSWKTESSSVATDKAIQLTPNLNDWYIKHAENSRKTQGKKHSKTEITNPKTNNSNIYKRKRMCCLLKCHTINLSGAKVFLGTESILLSQPKCQKDHFASV